MTTSGVYPCYENQFQIETTASTFSTIAECTTFSISIDNGVEEWTPFDTEGWTKRLPTSKSVTISVTAQRSIGDAGNDFVAGLAFKNGQDAYAGFKWTLPSGMVVIFANAVINVKNLGSGDSTAVAPLEFDVMSNGKPTITEAGKN